MRTIDDLISSAESKLAELKSTRESLEVWNIGDLVSLKSGNPIRKFEPTDPNDNKYHGYITDLYGRKVLINGMSNPVSVDKINLVSSSITLSAEVGDMCEIMYTDKQHGKAGDIGQVIEVYHLYDQRFVKLNNTWRDTFGGHKGGVIRLLKPRPHKHAEIIKAWADGAIVQAKIGGSWVCQKLPEFSILKEYRIAPQVNSMEVKQ